MKRRTKRTVVYVVGISSLLGVTLFLLAGGGNSTEDASPYSASALAAEESDFDFGTVPINGGDVYHDFSVRNAGGEPVVIQKVYTSCMCTSALIINSSGEEYGEFGMPGHGVSPETSVEVGPGESVVVKAIFDPAAHGPSGVGLADRSIYLETNSARSPKLELSFRAMVTP